MARTTTKTAKKPAAKAAKVPAKATKPAKAPAKAAKPAAATKAAKAAKPSPAKKPAMTLSVIKPSVNNLSVRIFARAAKLGIEETDAYGATRTKAYLAKNPAHLTPMLEEKGLPRRAL